MDKSDVQARMQAAFKLLSQDAVTTDTFDQIKTLLKGVNPQLDKKLTTISQVLAKYKKISNKEIIELTAEHLPEKTAEQKKRKKALLLLINGWDDLKSEVKRLQHEFQKPQETHQEKMHSFGRIVAGARGPFGIGTLVALVVIGVMMFGSNNNVAETAQDVSPAPTQALENTTKVKGIIYQEKKIPLSEFRVGEGPECDKDSHYHARNDISVTAVDGSIFYDPAGCGFGKVKDVKVVDIE